MQIRPITLGNLRSCVQSSGTDLVLWVSAEICSVFASCQGDATFLERKLLEYVHSHMFTTELSSWLAVCMAEYL